MFILSQPLTLDSPTFCVYEVLKMHKALPALMKGWVPLQKARLLQYHVQKIKTVNTSTTETSISFLTSIHLLKGKKRKNNNIQR